MIRRAVFSVCLTALTMGTLAGCNEEALNQPSPDAGAAVGGLTPEQSARVLAKIGDKTITLGDFAQTLERMDQFDRLRYQTKERRRELLNDIVDVELLAMEARRRGLDKLPEAEDAMRQILRDALLAAARAKLPQPSEIPISEISAYYQANEPRFNEPERRRVAAIVMSDKKEAEKVLKAALKVKNAAEWGELFGKSSETAPKAGAPSSPVDLAGDLGIVGPMDDPKGANPKVPDALRAAVFKITSVGAVAEQLISDGGKHYIVRLNGLTAAHHRSLAEADRSIRIALLQDKMQKLERDLEAELRKKFPVEIDDRALGAVKMPEGLDRPDATSGSSPLWGLPDSDAGAGQPAAPEGSAAPRAPDGRP